LVTAPLSPVYDGATQGGLRVPLSDSDPETPVPSAEVQRLLRLPPGTRIASTAAAALAGISAAFLRAYFTDLCSAEIDAVPGRAAAPQLLDILPSLLNEGAARHNDLRLFNGCAFGLNAGIVGSWCDNGNPCLPPAAMVGAALAGAALLHNASVRGDDDVYCTAVVHTNIGKPEWAELCCGAPGDPPERAIARVARNMVTATTSPPTAQSVVCDTHSRFVQVRRPV
jgi:hypothetical protein